MIITKINLDDLSECSVQINNTSKPIDVFTMLKYLSRATADRVMYINWDKHLFNKDLIEVL